PGGGRGIVVHLLGGERRDLEEGRTRVEQGGDAVAHRQLASRDVFGERLLAAARGRAREAAVEFARQLFVVGGVVDERLLAGVQVGTKDGRGGPGQGGNAEG